MKEKKIDLINGLAAPMMAMVATAGIMGGLMKMFGTDSLPQGVIREMMQGVMDGLLMHFEGKIEDLKEKVKTLEKEKEEIEEQKDRAEDRLEVACEKIEELTPKPKVKKKKK